MSSYRMRMNFPELQAKCYKLLVQTTAQSCTAHTQLNRICVVVELCVHTRYRLACYGQQHQSASNHINIWLKWNGDTIKKKKIKNCSAAIVRAYCAVWQMNTQAVYVHKSSSAFAWYSKQKKATKNYCKLNSICTFILVSTRHSFVEFTELKQFEMVKWVTKASRLISGTRHPVVQPSDVCTSEK